MALGNMNERLLLQQNNALRNTHGGYTPDDWDDVATIYAERIPLTGGELIEASRVGSETRYRFRIRARADVRPTWRALWTPVWPKDTSQLIVEIHAVFPDPKDRSYQLLECGVHDGVQETVTTEVDADGWVQEGWI